MYEYMLFLFKVHKTKLNIVAWPLCKKKHTLLISYQPKHKIKYNTWK